MTTNKAARLTEVIRDPCRVANLTDEELHAFTTEDVSDACWLEAKVTDVASWCSTYRMVNSIITAISREGTAREFAKEHHIQLEDARRVVPLVLEGGKEARPAACVLNYGAPMNKAFYEKGMLLGGKTTGHMVVCG